MKLTKKQKEVLLAISRSKLADVRMNDARVLNRLEEMKLVRFGLRKNFDNNTSVL